jgi:hypothetical protein
MVCRAAERHASFAGAVVFTEAADTALRRPNTARILVDVQSQVVNSFAPVADVDILKGRLEVFPAHPKDPIYSFTHRTDE